MKATELRIGNYVWDDYSGEMIVSQINNEWIYLRKTLNLTDGAYKIDSIKPIPLTEEWLLKLHSEDDIKISTRFPNEVNVFKRFRLIWKAEYKYWYVVTSGSKEYLTKIEFVHEYQNFIFALVGEELLIT